jgi:deoxyribonuclease-2
MTFKQITGRSLKDTGALGHTLDQIYKGQEGYLMWNDETPDGKTSSTHAHAKGVMGYTSTGGFLLRHSTPRFPPDRSEGYHGLPQDEHIYGQTYLCTSVTLATLNQIAGQYLVTNLQLYGSHIPAYASSYRNITSLSQGNVAKGWNQSVYFKSVGGTTFYDMSKSKDCDCDLWDKVALSMAQPLNVLSWGRPLEPSSCPTGFGFQVQNVIDINWGGSVSYKESQEHSKWAVTANHRYLCIGDINRMVSQKKRGGGTTCINSIPAAASFAKLIAGLENC